MMRFILAALLLSTPALAADSPAAPEAAKPPATLRLPNIFTRHMVVQRDRPLPIWGHAAPGETITAALGTISQQTKADAQGQWRLTLPAQPAGGPHELRVSSQAEQMTVDDVLIGEVWVCSGQSNMEWPVKEAADAAREIAAADHPIMRLFTVPHVVAKEPQLDCGGSWEVCSPSTVGEFSAVAYYFGRELNRKLGVPVGLIDSSWGGSVCEAWMSREALSADPNYADILRRAAGDNIGKGCGMYNAMIHPLIPYALRGVIWYQGESNASRAWQYRKLFPDLIRDWRTRWGQGDFPFYYVQLAPLDRNRDEWVELRESQLRTLSVPNTGMAVIHDLGPPGLHPIEKQGVGERLARWALAKDYGQKEIVYSGPLYSSMAVEGPAIRLRFDHATGLASRDSQPLGDFTIAGEDRQFQPATATIDGDTILVHGDKVPRPVAIRLGWIDAAQPNLVNGAGLPASPFRTDDWPCVTVDRK